MKKKSVEFPLTHINTIDVLDNGFSLSRKRKTKTEYFVGFGVVGFELEVSPNIDEGEDFDKDIVKWDLTGEEVKSMIQKLLQE